MVAATNMAVNAEAADAAVNTEAADATVDVEAATEQTRNQSRTHENNATVLRVQQTKQSKIKEKRFIYIGEEETYRGTKTKSMKLQKKR